MSTHDNWSGLAYALEKEFDIHLIRDFRLDYLVMPRGTGIYADVLIDGNGYCIYHMPESAVKTHG